MKKKKGMALLGAVVMLLFAAVLPGMAKVKAAGPTADVSAGNVSAKSGDKISMSISVMQKGYLFDMDTDLGQYEIQCELQYEQEV